LAGGGVPRTRGTHTGQLCFGSLVIKATGKRVEAAPEASSMTFNAQGQCTRLTVRVTTM
jgi:hypothetical protein